MRRSVLAILGVATIGLAPMPASAQQESAQCRQVESRWSNLVKQDALMTISFKDAVLNTLNVGGDTRAVKCAYSRRFAADAAEINRLQKYEQAHCLIRLSSTESSERIMRNETAAANFFCHSH